MTAGLASAARVAPTSDEGHNVSPSAALAAAALAPDAAVLLAAAFAIGLGSVGVPLVAE